MSEGLTEDSFNEFLREYSHYRSYPPTFIVSRTQKVHLDVAAKPESWIKVRKPLRKRVRSSITGFMWRDEYGRRRPLRKRWATAKRMFRPYTMTVLTEEAQREIQWKLAALQPVTKWGGRFSPDHPGADTTAEPEASDEA